MVSDTCIRIRVYTRSLVGEGEGEEGGNVAKFQSHIIFNELTQSIQIYIHSIARSAIQLYPMENNYKMLYQFWSAIIPLHLLLMYMYTCMYMCCTQCHFWGGR